MCANNCSHKNKEVSLVCSNQNCKKTFSIKKWDFNKRIKRSTKNFFCSRKCNNEYIQHSTNVVLTCSNPNCETKTFEVKQSVASTKNRRGTKNVYCSHKCHNEHLNTSSEIILTCSNPNCKTKHFSRKKGKVRASKRRGNKKIFCSRACKDKYIQEISEVSITCSNPNCSKPHFKIKKGVLSVKTKIGVKKLFCSRKCSLDEKKHKKNLNLCMKKGCFKNAVVVQGESRFCSEHYQEKITIRKKNKEDKDLLSRYILSGLIPEWSLNLSTAREEFVKIFILQLCHKHYIRQERETICGISNETKRPAIEEDIYLLDLKWLISCKRNSNTTTQKHTDEQLKNSSSLFKENREGKIKVSSVAIDNIDLVSDQNLLQWTRTFKKRTLDFHKSGKIKLWKGVRTFTKDVDLVISILEDRFKKVRNGTWREDIS